jgi:hypothetical protein
MGYVALGWQWVVMAGVARRQLAAGEGNAPFLEAKLKTARFYVTRLLPQTSALLTQIQAGAAAIMAPSPEEF